MISRTTRQSLHNCLKFNGYWRMYILNIIEVIELINGWKSKVDKMKGFWFLRK